MRKMFALLAVAALVAFAAPAFAANPFADVPLNNWAYDAVSQLAANGIVAGYPDGTYKGGQPATRYEMAIVVGRALAKIDMNKANKQDVEVLKKLAVEFKSELDALGVKANGLDGRVAALEENVGGWKFNGEFQFDSRFAENDGSLYTSTGDADFQGTKYWIWLQKRVDDKVNVTFRIGNADEWADKITKRIYGDLDNDALALQRAYATIQLPQEWTLTVGKQDLPDFEADAGISNGASFFSDENVAMKGFALGRSFQKGNFKAFVSHFDIPDYFNLPDFEDILSGDFDQVFAGNSWDAYFYGARFGWQPLENLAFGANYLVLDMDDVTIPAVGNTVKTLWFDGAVTVKPGVALKGAYYTQNPEAMEEAYAWKAVLDVNQDALKYTGLWVEYARMDNGFIVNPMAYAFDQNTLASAFGVVEVANIANGFASDLEVWNVRADQKWNDKWGTFQRYVKVDSDLVGLDASNWTLGAVYHYTPAVSFELAYDNMEFGDAIKAVGLDDDSMIRFRTSIAF